MINCCYRTKIWQKRLLISNMLTFNNTSVNIKEEDGFFVPYGSETISGKVKNCTITNFTGSQVLVMIKNIRKQNHLGLNKMLLNYYKWRQIMHCKRFCYCQWTQMTLVSNKIYIIGFPKRNYFDHWKAYCRKRVIYAPKICCLTKFYTPLHMSSKTDLLQCLLWSRPGLLSIQSAISFTNLNFAKCKFT